MDLLDVVREAVERARELRRAGRDPREAGEELRSIRKVCNLLDLEFARVAAEFARSQEYDRDGYVSPVSWIRHECNVTAHAAGSAIRVGDQEPVLTESLAAMNDGEIGFAHLALLAGTAEAVRTASPSGEFDERPLLRLARSHMVNRFRSDCAHVRHAADQQAYLQEHLQDVSCRRLELQPFEGGALAVKGFFDSVAGATLRTALEPLARPMGAGDDRHRERRLADALVELASHGLDAGVVPQRAGVRPHLQVTVSLETLQGNEGAPAAELEFGAPIPAVAAQRLACDSSMTRVLLDADSAIVDVGRTRRLPSVAARRALRVRDRSCTWPGCDRPASWCQAHHSRPFAQGGLTDMANLVLLCHRHHWMVHEGGWKLVRGEDERILAIPPLPGYMPRAPDWRSAA